MAQKRSSGDPVFGAVEKVHAAIRDLTPEQRGRVFSAIAAMVDLTWIPTQTKGTSQAAGASQDRKVGLNELTREKSPGTVPQMITLFAYFREKMEGISRFDRLDLKPYFSKAKEKPPGNFDRDFVKAVKQGWIHEEGDQSYITSKGIETVERGFEGERKYRTSKPRAAHGTAKKARRRKS